MKIDSKNWNNAENEQRNTAASFKPWRRNQQQNKETPWKKNHGSNAGAGAGAGAGADLVDDFGKLALRQRDLNQVAWPSISSNNNKRSPPQQLKQHHHNPPIKPASASASARPKPQPQQDRFLVFEIAILPSIVGMAAALQDSLSSPTCLYKPYPGTKIFISEKDLRVRVHQTTNAAGVRVELKRLFQKIHIKGFIEWLAGKQGWELDSDEPSWTPYCDAFNKLQEVYKIFAPKAIKFTDGRDNNKDGVDKKLLWTKESHIKESITNVRTFFEALYYFDENPRERSSLLLSSKQGSGRNSPHRRWQRIMVNVRNLMRTSKYGPDTPIHWSAHGRYNRYNLALITGDLLREVIRGLIHIFQDLFFVEDKCLGTIWYEKQEFSGACWSTEKNKLPDFATTKKFEALLNNTTAMTTN